MTRHKRIGKMIWWGMLALWLFCLGAGICFLLGMALGYNVGILGTPSYFLSYFYFIFAWLFSEGDSVYRWVLAIPYVGLFIFTQWLFLSSKKHWKIKTQTTGRPMKKAVIGVAFATMLLSVGLVFSLLDLIPKDLHNNEAGGILGYIIFSLPIALWIVWSFIFTVYFFQKDYLKWSGKIIKGLIGGSILELFISIPIFITHEEDCYCARWSYAGLVFGITVLLWAFGPGIFLLYWREKKRLEDMMPNDNNNK